MVVESVPAPVVFAPFLIIPVVVVIVVEALALLGPLLVIGGIANASPQVIHANPGGLPILFVPAQKLATFELGLHEGSEKQIIGGTCSLARNAGGPGGWGDGGDDEGE